MKRFKAITKDGQLVIAHLKKKPFEFSSVPRQMSAKSWEKQINNVTEMHANNTGDSKTGHQ